MPSSLLLERVTIQTKRSRSTGNSTRSKGSEACANCTISKDPGSFSPPFFRDQPTDLMILKINKAEKRNNLNKNSIEFLPALMNEN